MRSSVMRTWATYFPATRLWLIFPVVLSLFRLAELGAFGQPRVGSANSDFYAYASVARLLTTDDVTPAAATTTGIEAPRWKAFAHPHGMPLSIQAEFLSEPLWQGVLRLTSVFTSTPIQALWLAIVLSTLFNIWGVWTLLWRRYAAATNSDVPRAIPIVIAWAVLCLSPWPWARGTVHWFLGWIPILLACVLLWWDVFTKNKPIPIVFGLIAHFLLLAQSVYYGGFLILLVLFWCVVSAVLDRGSLRSQIRRVALASVVAAGGYAIDAAWVTANLGGPSALQASVSQTRRTDYDLHAYAVRMRELTKGGVGSLQSRLGAKVSRDGEGFPSPLPKLALLGLIVLALAARKRRELVFALTGVLGFLVIGLQELPWIRFEVLSHVFPFMRGYARIMMPILCLIAILAVETLPAVFSRWPALKQPKRAGLFAASALLLLLADYGWPQPAHEMQSEIPCGDARRIASSANLPIYFDGDTARAQSACGRYRDWIVYAATGLPQFGIPWQDPAAACPPPAATEPFLLWFEGSERAWTERLRCFGTKQLVVLADLPMAQNGGADPGNVRLRLVRVTP